MTSLWILLVPVLFVLLGVASMLWGVDSRDPQFSLGAVRDFGGDGGQSSR